MDWLPFVIGRPAILALIVQPRGKDFFEASRRRQDGPGCDVSVTTYWPWPDALTGQSCGGLFGSDPQLSL
jgi:hypothetical protein